MLISSCFLFIFSLAFTTTFNASTPPCPRANKWTKQGNFLFSWEICAKVYVYLFQLNLIQLFNVERAEEWRESESWNAKSKINCFLFFLRGKVILELFTSTRKSRDHWLDCTVIGFGLWTIGTKNTLNNLPKNYMSDRRQKLMPSDRSPSIKNKNLLFWVKFCTFPFILYVCCKIQSTKLDATMRYVCSVRNFIEMKTEK